MRHALNVMAGQNGASGRVTGADASAADVWATHAALSTSERASFAARVAEHYQNHGNERYPGSSGSLTPKLADNPSDVAMAFEVYAGANLFAWFIDYILRQLIGRYIKDPDRLNRDDGPATLRARTAADRGGTPRGRIGAAVMRAGAWADDNATSSACGRAPGVAIVRLSTMRLRTLSASLLAAALVPACASDRARGKPAGEPNDGPAAMPTDGAETLPTDAGAEGKAFDHAAATAALSAAADEARACKEEGGPTGDAKVEVTFAPSGDVTSADVEGPPFAGTPVGGCVASAFSGARVPPFDGSPVRITKSVGIE